MVQSLIYIALVLGVVALCTRPLGAYMARVLSDERVWLETPLGGLEQLLYRLCAVDPKAEMNWRRYALALLLFGALGIVFLFGILVLQPLLPFNPQGFPAMSADQAFNVAVSFVTNTNWQSYGGETTLSHFSQMAGLAVQNFISAATGIAVACALFRGIARKQTSLLGNAWADIVRSVLYILLPLSLLFAIFLMSQGVVQNFSAAVSYTPVQAVEGESLIATGPAASQIAIKMLGSNGGGFFNANGAHPFENPTPLANFFQIVAILLIPASLVYTFGAMVGDRRQAWSLLAAMTLIFLPLVLLATQAELAGNPNLDIAAISQPDGNMEGKEVRNGVVSSMVWAVATTATSNGSVNAAHDSLLPLAGMIPLLFIQFGEVIFGGVGTGAYGMLIYVVITVFIGGLMVGRTPEYLGKKLGAFEIKMASLCILIPAFVLLGGTALAVATEAGRAGVFNPGAQGFSELLYNFSSATNNNGSAFAGMNANTPFYNIVLAVAMLIGRYGVILPVLAIAGSLAAKNTAPVGQGTLPTHTPLFVVMLVASILLVDVLTYVPVLAMGPVAEHLHLYHLGKGGL
jgi:K+-transporting ATPase ATPase A chain